MLYWRGLQQPIHFFPETSWTYQYEISVKQSDHEKALRSANKAWYGNAYFKELAESEKTGNKLLFNKIDPFDEQFVELAGSIIQPMIIHSSDLAHE
jgi:exonuclease V gamma subunit